MTTVAVAQPVARVYQLEYLEGEEAKSCQDNCKDYVVDPTTYTALEKPARYAVHGFSLSLCNAKLGERVLKRGHLQVKEGEKGTFESP